MKSKRPPSAIICEVCGEDFWARSDAKTCSPRCKKARQRKIKKEGSGSED